MAESVDSPLYPKHDNRRGCPQSGGLLHEFINKGLAEFSSVVEIIRILELERTQQGQRLITDFIKFRHLTAHKRVSDLGYLQMMAAFVLYCRKTVQANDIGSPATIKVLGEEFARMADINVVVCATWYFNIHNLRAVRSKDRKTLVTSLNGYVKYSSFSDYSFAASDNDISVYHKGWPNNKKFDGNLLKELAEVLKTPVKYTEAEINEFKNVYNHAAKMAEAQSTHAEVQGVLGELTIGCTCPMDDLADELQNMHVAPKCLQF